jgi:hypothetical protein
VQDMKKLLLFFIIINFFVALSATETYIGFRGFVSAGGGYDSYIPSLGKDSTERKGSGEILADGGINLDINDFSIGTAVFVNALNADNWRYSLLNTELNMSYTISKGDFDWSVFSVGSFSFYDFENIATYYGQGNLYLEMFYNHHDDMSFFFTLTGSYIHGINDKLSYLRGPQVGVETGEYFYFGESSYLRLQYQLNFFFYKDHSVENMPYLSSEGVQSLTGRNKGLSQFLSLRTKLGWDSIYFLFSAGYRNTTMFERDVWETADRIVKKRRVDHATVLDFEPVWTPLKSLEDFSIHLHYVLERNFSTFGENDYNDENYIRHNIRLLMSYYF